MELDFNVEISNDVSEYEALYNKLFKKTLNMLNVSENAIMSVTFVSKEQIHQINKTYRNIDRPTDVISFALEDDETFVKTDYRVLGDIYICLDKARSQAIEYGHSFKREICFLSIHGLLHLLGYDHMNPEDEKVMFGLQEKILNEFGITRE